MTPDTRHRSSGGPRMQPDNTEPDEQAEQLERLRSENERLRRELEHEAEAPEHPGRGRHVGAVVLVVLGSLLLPASVLTVWVRNQVLDTDRYVETVTPLAGDAAIRSAVAKRISDRVSEEVDFKGLAKDVLPDEASFLATPIAAGANSLVATASEELVASDRFQQLWEDANRVGHDALVAVLTGSEGDVVSTDDGKVVLKLGGLAQKVLEEIDAQFGLDLAGTIPAEDLDVDFVLIESEQLADAQGATRLLDRLSWLTVILALGLLIGSVALEPDHRRGIRNVGIGVALSMAALLVGIGLGREAYLASLPGGVRLDAAEAVFDILTRFVLQSIRVLFAVGAVLFVGAWLAGPSSSARSLRGLWNSVLGRGSAAAGSAVDLGPVPGWVAGNIAVLRVVVLAVALLVLLAWDRPTGLVVLLIAVLTLVPLAAIQFLARAAPSPQAS